MDTHFRTCPDCGETSRRGFLKATAGAAAVAAGSRLVRAAEPRPDETPEALVRKLHESLNDEQRKVVALGWDHPHRLKVSNNWRIVDVKIGKFYTAEQQQLIRDIFRGLVSDEGAERFARSMKDDYDGFDNYSCCIFGNPAEGKFSWVLTGRHVTMRCDGDSNERVAFGGPMFYGHAVEFNEKPDHPGNVWWHQARLANKVYAALDGKQRARALVKRSPADSDRSIALRTEGFPGLPVAELSADQKGLVEQCMKELLGPYRESDVDEAMAYVKQAGGLDAVHVSFYQDGDLGGDKIWDRWKLESPALSWYFRGSPHVHTWVNIAQPKA